MPFFSIILPTYNRASFLSRSIGSVLRQDFQDWELLIIDDGSTDQTSSILESFGNAIIYIRTSDRGFTQKGRWGSPDGYVSPGLRRGKRKAPCLASVRYLN